MPIISVDAIKNMAFRVWKLTSPLTSSAALLKEAADFARLTNPDSETVQTIAALADQLDNFGAGAFLSSPSLVQQAVQVRDAAAAEVNRRIEEIQRDLDERVRDQATSAVVPIVGIGVLIVLLIFAMR